MVSDSFKHMQSVRYKTARPTIVDLRGVSGGKYGQLIDGVFTTTLKHHGEVEEIRVSLLRLVHLAYGPDYTIVRRVISKKGDDENGQQEAH